MTKISLNREVEDALSQAEVGFLLASVDCNLYEVKIARDKSEIESDKITEAIKNLTKKGIGVNEKKINACALCTTYVFSRGKEKVSVSVLFK